MWKMTKSNYYEVIEGKTMYYEDYVKKIQKEIVELKEKLDIAEANYDIIYGYFTQVNDLLGTELCEEVLDKILKLKRNNNILIEFEKWFEERYRQQTETLKKMEEDNIEKRYVKARRYLVEECLDKLQELKKEGKK